MFAWRTDLCDGELKKEESALRIDTKVWVLGVGHGGHEFREKEMQCAKVFVVDTFMDYKR